MTTGSKANTEPDAHRHYSVVNNVQERNVFVLFAQHEEELFFFCLKRQKKQNDFQLKKFVKFVNEALNSTYSVKKLGEFREVVPPASVHHLNRQENFAEYKSHTNEYISLMNRHENVRHLKN